VLNLKAVSQFKKDIKKYQHKKAVIEELDLVIKFLRDRTKLPVKYQDHNLTGDYVGMRECHLKPDTLLVYWIDQKGKTLYLERIGSHSELF
jgi:mRNA interferase YafQ